MDWMPQEQERGITITSAATKTSWRDHTINIIDTPGHVDFTVEVERNLRVLDGAVAVYDAVAGVEPQTEQVWRQADKYGVPRMCFVNKMDRTGANFFRTVDMIRDRLNATPLVLQLPWGVEADFVGVLDLVRMKGLRWTARTRARRTRPSTSRPSCVEEAETWRATLLETLAENDDQVLEAWLGGHRAERERDQGRHPPGDDRPGAHPGPARLRVQEQGRPAHARRGRGLPAQPAGRPGDRRARALDGETEVLRHADATEPFSALAFKIQTDQHLGKLTYIRVYSGKLDAGSPVLNSTKDRKERVGKIFQMHANKREERPRRRGRRHRGGERPEADHHR